MRIVALGHAPYIQTFHAMLNFTQMRQVDTADEIWLVEHPPVFTQGQAGKPEHVINTHNIPLVQTDRGGQVTYHGPGQVIAYVLFDLRRAGYFVKEFVHRLEQAVIDTLTECGVAQAQRQTDAPGIYVPHDHSWNGVAKIAALGLKVRKGCTYHGVSLNVDMDLQPFTYINPCGYAGLHTTDMASQGAKISLSQAGIRLSKHIQTNLG